jgi:hypothetical protein
MKTKEQVREWNRRATKKYRQKHPERVRFIKAKQQHGVCKEMYDVRMYDVRMSEQDFLCGICREAFCKTPHIDHNHFTNDFRGLLCSGCNHLLGFSKDSILILEQAIQYLKKYGDYNGGKET